ncbi:MAG: efflux RND transporter periplasmic adaptor subunit [Parvibaculum sp.]|uniref:efflux RND transporter periplasmic adaptor subunit n=1 Tax=Parvibaculum sp. TaxID=2024848 RepID=UPI00349FF486
MRLPTPAILLLAALLVPAALSDARAQEKAQNVIVAPAVFDRFVDQVEALGTTFANESVTITANVSDKVDEILFNDGQQVEKDQVLVLLRREEQRAALEAAEAILSERLTAYNRARELESRQYTTTAQLDERRAALREAEANRDGARARFDDREIRAPFEGVVGLRNISPGTLVTPGSVITSLDDLDPIKLDFTVPAAYLANIQPGLEIRATTTALPDKEFRGTVRSVATQVDRVTRSITARAFIPNEDHALKPGLLMTIRLLKNPRDSIVIPEEALVPSGTQNFVFVIDRTSNKAARREIETGGRRPGAVEVVSGLERGELVVTHGTMQVRDGQTVNIVKEETPEQTLGRLGATVVR